LQNHIIISDAEENEGLFKGTHQLFV